MGNGIIGHDEKSAPEKGGVGGVDAPSDEAGRSKPARRAGPWGAGAAIAAAVGVMLLYLWLAGRVWWCACGTPTFFVADPATAHNSQHVFDWYSFSHLLHGVIFLLVLQLSAPRLGAGWKLAIAVGIEAAWEMVENSPIVINRYREATAALGYAGDSIVNSVGDLGFMVAGFFLARAIGWKWSLALFVALELVMLWAIRDNLTLNVVMLLWPLESIKTWQLGPAG